MRLPLRIFILISAFCPLLGWADIYDDGLKAYKKKNYEKAREIWMDPELENDPRALFSLGRIYMSGKGVEEDYVTGVNYYLQSAELGYNPAKFNLGLAYLKGRGVDKDVAEAARWWEQAAAEGHGPAQFNFGALLWTGEDIPQDQVSAMTWFKLAYVNGNDEASQFLRSLFEPMQSELTPGLKLYRGKGTTRVISENDENAQFNLAQKALDDGSYELAYKNWMTLAKDGHDLSQFMVGQLYETGKGVSADFDQAMEWYQMAAKAGNPNAQYRIGLYHINEAQEKNRTLGLYWIQSAADQKFPEAVTFMQNGG